MANDGADSGGLSNQFLYRVILLALIPVLLQCQLLLPGRWPSTQPIQMIVTALIFIMVLVLLWQTFPLRYGLLGVLVREFKWTFVVVLAFLGTNEEK